MHMGGLRNLTHGLILARQALSTTRSAPITPTLPPSSLCDKLNLFKVIIALLGYVYKLACLFLHFHFCISYFFSHCPSQDSYMLILYAIWIILNDPFVFQLKSTKVSCFLFIVSSHHYFAIRWLDKDIKIWNMRPERWCSSRVYTLHALT